MKVENSYLIELKMKFARILKSPRWSLQVFLKSPKFALPSFAMFGNKRFANCKVFAKLISRKFKFCKFGLFLTVAKLGRANLELYKYMQIPYLKTHLKSWKYDIPTSLLLIVNS